MKGYLQRIAATVINPAQSVQPILATVFAAPRSEPDPAAGEWPESPTAIAKPTEASRRTPDVEPDRPKTPIAETIPFEPLVQTLANPPLNDPPRQPAAAREPQGNTATRVFASRNRKEFRDPVTFEPLVQTLANHSLNDPPAQPAAGNPVPPAQIGVEPPTETQATVETRRLSPAIFPRGRSQTLVNPARGRRSASNEADEVHIHIGRIEVTAVPPAAPPAIPKPVRRSPNLDEYLSRSR